jgi:hypothetical protein
MRPSEAAVLALLALGVATVGGAAPDKAAPDAPKRGLILNDPRALQGYTLLAPIQSTKTYLLDMQGRVVRTWESESSGALTTRLLENGHLLRGAKLAQQLFGDGPGAGGHLQEFTWEGDLVWDFKYASADRLQHHDLCRMPNGNILLIAWEKKTADEAVAAGRRPETVGKGPLLPDCIVEIQPTGKTTGKVVWEWHVWDHLVQDHDAARTNYGDVAAHPELIDLNFGEGAMAAIVAKKDELAKLRAIGYVGAATPGGKPAPVRADWLHCNAVDYNAELDQILINSPEFNEFWVIDHGTSTAEAASHSGGKSGKGGDLLYRWGNPRSYRAGAVKDQKLFFQHNTQWIPRGYPGEGHILIFNNGQRRPGGAHSTVDEIIPPVEADGHYQHKPGTAYGPDKAIWSYAAPKRTEFFASFISGANRLPNGDTFICAGQSGTLFEVTPDKQVVWKYVNPSKPMPAPTPPQLVQVLPTFLRDPLKVTDEQSGRLAELQKELEAKVDHLLTEEQKKQMHAPAPSPGPGAPTAPVVAPDAVQVLPVALRPRLKLTEEQKKRAEELQKEAEQRMGQILTSEQLKQLKEMRERFVNGWGGQPPPPPSSGVANATRRPPGGPNPPPPAGGGPPNLDSAVYRSYRYAANYPGLAGKDLTPGKTVEELQAGGPGGK